MKVIGITGTNGSGKGTVVEILKRNFPELIHRSTRDVITKIAESEGVNISSREDLTNFANDYNAVRGNSFFKTFIEENIQSQNIYVLESIRRIHEVKIIRELLKQDFIFLAVDADVEVRYKRVFENRKGEITDNVSFEDFQKEEMMEQNSDEKKQNLNGCISIADFVINNNSDFENLNNQIQDFVSKNKGFFE